MPNLCVIPFQLVHVDFTSIETEWDLGKPPQVNDVLVIRDHFTWYTQTFVTPNQKAKTVAKVLYDHFISIFGAPEKILSDRCVNFTSHIVQVLCDMFGIKKVKTTPYHAQCNGQVERFHQTLMRMVGKVWYNRETDWSKHLPEVVQAYNRTCLAITVFAPLHYVWAMPHIDLHFPTVHLGKQCSLPSYLAILCEQL